MPLQLQMIPSEMLPLARTETLPNGSFDKSSGVIRQGIEFDRIGRRVAYRFLRRHPGDVADPGVAGETARIPASEIVRVIDPVDAGPLRGVSRFAPAIVKLFLSDRYDDAELDRKKVAAMHALFIAAPALGVLYAYLSTDRPKADCSNSRLALLEFRRRVEAWQRSVLVFQLCRAVWRRWMDAAVMSGALDIRDYEQRRAEYLACSWLPPRWEWVDPLKDARAEIERIDAELKSRTQALAERGFDAEQVDAEIAADKTRERGLGLVFGSNAPGAAPDDIAPEDRVTSAFAEDAARTG